MSEIQSPGSHCHLCSGYIAPTEWFYDCQTCYSEKPKQPFHFCSLCTSSTAHPHPVARDRECSCALRQMSTFAVSLLNRFTAFAHRTLISFPIEQFPLSSSPFQGELPAQACLTYGQVPDAFWPWCWWAYCFDLSITCFQLLMQAQSLHRHFAETLKLSPHSGILVMADVYHSAAWLTVDIAALFGGYLSIPMNVSDSAKSISLVIAKHQVANDFPAQSPNPQIPTGLLLCVHSSLPQNCWNGSLHVRRETLTQHHF